MATRWSDDDQLHANCVFDDDYYVIKVSSEPKR